MSIKVSNYTGVEFPFLLNNYGNMHQGGTDKGNIIKEGSIKVNATIDIPIDIPDGEFYHLNILKMSVDKYAVSVYIFPDDVGKSYAVYRLNSDIPNSTTPADSTTISINSNDANFYIALDGTFNVKSIDQADFISKDTGSRFCRMNPKDTPEDYVMAARTPEDTFGATGTPSTRESCSNITYWPFIIIGLLILGLIIVIVVVIIIIKKRKKNQQTY